MKFAPIILLLTASLHAADTIVLDETKTKNLRIETATVVETDFEETFFSLGHIEAVPENIAAVSSRIPGRIVELSVTPGDRVEKGQVVAKVESRQPGNPPPVIPLESPISGTVTELNIHLGDPINPDTHLLKITDLSKMYAVAKVPEHLAGRISKGTKAHIRVVALKDDSFKGEMLRFGTTADEESGTIDAIFGLPNPENRLRAGMRTEFSVVLSERKNVLSIPRAALQGDTADRFVYIRHFDLKYAFVKTPVVVGEMNDRLVEIQSGLFPGDEVVTKGAYSLSYAGASSISLKEALDAAHGHEHAEDGSELTGDEKETEDDHDHGDDGDHDHGTSPFWKYAAILLALLLIASLLSKSFLPASED